VRVGVNTLFLIPGEVGGSETYVRDILGHAVSRHPDISWVLFTNAENHDLFGRLFGGNGNVRLWPLHFQARNRPSRIIREQCQLPLAVRRAGVDVLWSPGYTAPLWCPCPQVVSVLDMQYREFPEDLSPAALLATRLLVPAAVHVARRVLTLSEFSRDQILKYVHTRREKIIPIHLAAAGEFRDPLPAEEGNARLKALVPPGPYILCVANTYPHKNVHTLVEAFGRLPGTTRCNLVLVGVERRGEPRVAAALARITGRDRVIRLRGLERRDLIALYHGAAVFAFPSLYEGFGLPVLEAMAAGVPVVTTSRGPMREIGVETIRYFDGTSDDLARQLESLLELDSGARDELVRKARERAGTFTWDHAADKTLEVLKSAAHRCPTSANMNCG